MKANRRTLETSHSDSPLRTIDSEELAAVTGGAQVVYDGWRGVPHRIIYGCGTMILVDAMFPISR